MTNKRYNSFYTYPDSLVGAVAAIEAIKGGVAILNSPTGCKFSSSFIVDKQHPENVEPDTTDFQEEFFSGQSRVPCTYLDELDYIHGSEEKLGSLLKLVEQKGFRLAGIVNGPGTALIGDDLAGIVKESQVNIPVLSIEASSFTGQASDGHNLVWEKLLKIYEQAEPAKGADLVITGSNLLSLRCMDDIQQLKDELAIAGIKNIVNVGAGTELQDIDRILNSKVIVSMNEPYGNKIAEKISGKYSAKNLSDGLLAPVGLQASEKWLAAVVKELNGDIDPLKEYFAAARKKLYRVLSIFHTRMSMFEGLTCFISTDSAIAAPLMLYLFDYLGIRPVAVSLLERAESSEKFIDEFINKRNLNIRLLTNLNQFDEANMLRELKPDIIFGSTNNYSVACAALNRKMPYVPVTYPESGKIYLARRPLMGIGGTLTLTENLINQINIMSKMPWL